MSNPFVVAEAAAYSAREKKRHYSLGTKLAAEAFGTFMLVLGVLAILAFSALTQYVNWFYFALVPGLLLMAAYNSVGGISGGHFNPAVTLGMAVAGRFHWRNVLPYIAAQLLGAVAGAFVVWAMIPAAFPGLLGFEGRGGLLATTASGFGGYSPLSQLAGGQTEFSLGVALLAEIIFTAVFVGVFLGVARRHHHRVGSQAGLTIGATFTAIYLLTWQITRGGINPARSFASVVFSGDGLVWQQLWLFFVGPLVGAALAALFYRAFAPVTLVPSDAALPELAEEYEVTPVTTVVEPRDRLVLVDDEDEVYDVDHEQPLDEVDDADWEDRTEAYDSAVEDAVANAHALDETPEVAAELAEADPEDVVFAEAVDSGELSERGEVVDTVEVVDASDLSEDDVAEEDETQRVVVKDLTDADVSAADLVADVARSVTEEETAK